MTHDFSDHCLTGSLEKINKAASEAVVGPDHGEKVEEILLVGSLLSPVSHWSNFIDQLTITVPSSPHPPSWDFQVVKPGFFCQLPMPVV